MLSPLPTKTPHGHVSHICRVLYFLFRLYFSVGSKSISGAITGHDAVRIAGAMPRPSGSISERGPKVEFIDPFACYNLVATSLLSWFHPQWQLTYIFWFGG